MNERIKILWSEAAESNFGDSWEEQTAFMSKFAESLIRKCADIGERYADGNYEVRNQILIHFGLEEPEE